MDSRKGVVIVLVLAMVVAFVPMSGSEADKSNSVADACEDCHNEFIPFEVEAKAPRNLKVGKKSTLVCRITNSADHQVSDLVARLLGPGYNGTGPEHSNFNGNLDRGSSASFDLEVKPGALKFTASMMEHPLPPGFADASLTLEAPDGDTITSDSGGTTETVEMSSNLLTRSGPGTYVITISHISGFRPLSFDLTVDIDYPDNALKAEVGDLEPGVEAEVRWDLTPQSKEEISELVVVVTGLVSQQHTDEGHQSETYTVEKKFESGSIGSSLTERPIEIPREIRWPVRYTLAALLPVSIVLGWSPVRDRIFKGISKARLKWFHCAISLGMVPLFFLHSLLATTRFTWTSPPAMAGLVVASLVSSLAVTGTYRRWLRSRIGERIWMLTHQVQVIALVIALAVHWYL